MDSTLPPCLSPFSDSRLSDLAPKAAQARLPSCRSCEGPIPLSLINPRPLGRGGESYNPEYYIVSGPEQRILDYNSVPDPEELEALITPSWPELRLDLRSGLGTGYPGLPRTLQAHFETLHPRGRRYSLDTSLTICKDRATKRSNPTRHRTSWAHGPVLDRTRSK